MGKKKFYRTIIVEGKTYEYKVGKTYTKIKGIGEFDNRVMTGTEYERDDFKVSVTPTYIELTILNSLKKTKKS